VCQRTVVKTPSPDAAAPETIYEVAAADVEHVARGGLVQFGRSSKPVPNP
jgi:hypothetical protein